MKTEDYSLIIKYLGIDDDASISSEECGEKTIYLTGTNAVSRKEYNYLIFCYDNNHKFNIKEYNTVKEKTKTYAFYTLIFIFDNLDQETFQYYEEYDKSTSRQKKVISEIFEKKVSVYRDKRLIDIMVDDGINYLEYKKFDGLKGYIYNVSFFELKKLFVVCGSDLFKQNVRLGVKSDSPEKRKLVSSFEKYVKVGFYNNIIGEFRIEEQEIKQYIMEDLQLFEEDLDLTNATEFCFKHNGVTIFVDDNQLNVIDTIIRLQSEKVSVINGAQTMTNLYKLLYENRYCLKKMYNAKEFEFIQKKYPTIGLFDKFLGDVINKICREIYIKTVFIVGDICYVTGISDGLNTHLPISEMDLLATGDNTYKINKMLEPYHIRIIKSGEYEDDRNISILEFVKYYKIIKGKPGASKNLNKNDIDKILNSIVENSNKEWILKIEAVINADIWWKNNYRGKKSTTQDELEDKICRYGRNYFLSYASLINEEDDFDNAYNNFVQLIKESELEINLDAFKKDELFDDIKNIYIQKGMKNNQNDIKKELQNKLQGNLIGKFNQNANEIIKETFDSLQLALQDFRIIRTDENNIPFENFSFSSKSFIELCNQNNNNYPAYEDSLFCKEIKKKRNFIILKIKNDEIRKVQVLFDVSFEGYSNEAKNVYQKTINAFVNGDEMAFPRISDDLGFHVRPHALSSQDTIIFTNGKEITKRSFWANKNIIQDIINSKS